MTGATPPRGSNTRLNAIVAGASLAASTFFTTYISLWVFALFFQQGLSGTTLWMVVLLLPCLLLLIPLLHSQARLRLAFQTISGLVLVPLASILGLVVQFDFNKNSLATMGLIDAVILLGVLNAQLDFTTIVRLATSREEVSRNHNASRMLDPWFLAGLAIPLICIGHVLSFVPSMSVAFFCVAIFYLVRSLLIPVLPDEIRDARASAEWPGRRPCRVDLWLRFAARWLVFACNAIIALYVTSERALPLWDAWLFGMVIGLLMLAARARSIDTYGWIATAGLVVEATLIWVDWTTLLDWPLMILNGVVSGLAWGWITDDLSRKASSVPALPVSHKFAQAFWIVAASVGIGVATHQMKFLVLDHASMLWLLPACIAGLAVGLPLLGMMGSRWGKRIRVDGGGIPAGMPAVAALAPSRPPTLGARSRRAIKAAALVLAISTTALCGLLQANSRASVRVEFGRTLYDVNGNPVDSVDLRERTARILLYSPYPTGVDHGENIRPAKTIRIGAYLYDARAIGNFTDAQARDWIARTMDVYSLGGYTNYTLFPDDVLAMRAINNKTRFYIMNFATTLGEYDNWTVDGPLGNATSIWNSTMDTWTLKLKSGEEAIGVRRSSADSKGHIMDLGSTGWADYYAWVWNSRVAAYHATGVAIDEVMWRGYWGTDIATLRDYTSIEQITETCYRWLERVHDKSTHEIITQAFWDEAQQYQDGIWGELAFRSGGAYGTRVDDRTSVIFYEAMDWEGIVQNLVSHGERDRSYIWAAWYNRDDVDALEYCVATYLMGKVNNCTSVVFHPQPTYDGGYPRNLAGYSLETVRQELMRHPELFDLELGDALGPMTLKRGAGGMYYQREFTNGIVLANPFHGFVPGFDYTPPENPSH